MRMLVIAIAWFMIGSIVFTTWPDWGIRIWNDLYYIWDASRDLLLLLALYNLIRRENQWLLKPLIGYTLIRLIWEIAHSVISMPVKMENISNIGFLALSVGAALLLLRDLKNRWERNS